MKDKEIYDLFNDVQFDIDEEESKLNDIEKKKIKKSVMAKIGNRKKKKKSKKLAVAVMIVALLGGVISPVGQEVIGAIKNKFFYEKGIGLVNEEEEILILKEPMILKYKGEEFLLKSVINKNEYLELSIFFNTEGKISELYNRSAGMDGIITIKTEGNKEVRVEEGALAQSGDKSYLNLKAKVTKRLERFILVINNEEFKIDLIEPKKAMDFDGVGGNSRSNDITIGANKYTIDGKRYLGIWTDKDVNSRNVSYIGFADDFKVLDKNKNEISKKPSEVDGSGRKFYLEEVIEGPVEVNIKKIYMDYKLKNPVEVKIDILQNTSFFIKENKEDLIIDVNQLIEIKELEEKILLKTIKYREEGIELIFDSSKYGKENSFITMLSGTRGGGYSASEGDKYISILISPEELSNKERKNRI